MIFRRIKAHIEKENWFAVFIDFLIVVVGVFIGIQVANWNTVNLSQAKEQNVLAQLNQEFKQVLLLTEKNLIINEKALKAIADVLKIIHSKTEPEDQDEFGQLLIKAGSFSSAPYEPTTLTELLSSGDLSDISSPSLRTALIKFHETMITHRKLADLTLQRVSTPNDGFHDAIIINPDSFINPGSAPLSSYDWDKLPATRQQFQVLLYGKTGLSTTMKQLIVDAGLILKEIEVVLKNN
jgi:hypothetical protein